jgi:hypothetical protein
MFPASFHRSVFLAMLAVVAFACVAAQAAGTASEISEDTSNTDDIKGELERRDRLEEDFFGSPPPPWLQVCREAQKKWNKRLGLDVAASYTVAGLVVLGSPGTVSGFSGDFTLVGSTVQGTQNGTQVDFELGSGDFFTAIQVGREFKLNGNPARFQAMLWHSDSVHDVGLPEGQGATLTFEHWLKGTKNRIFVRTAWSEGGASDVDRLFVGGLAIERRENDLYGIAAGLGRDSSGSKRWQAVLESFYRWQIGPNFHVSPETQLVFGSGPNSDHTVRLVTGIRGQIAF